MHIDILERDSLGAFCRHTHVAIEGGAAGGLQGLSFGLKDLYHVAGHKTGFGSPDWLRTHDAATQSSPVLLSLLAAGATMVGKTHTEEMAFSLTGENAHYGTPINPAAPDRVPGGSSSGSASAVAGKLVDFAIGSDTGGSVRGPASFCGIYGIRPTHGRISMAHACPLAPMFDTCGWFARDADMLARVGDVLLSETAGRVDATPTRLLVATDAFSHAMPDAADALQLALARVVSFFEARRGGAEDVVVSREGLRSWFDVFRVLQFNDINETHKDWIARVNPTFGPQIKPRFDAVRKSDAVEVSRMQTVHDDIRARLEALLEGGHVLVLPTMPDVAPLLNSSPGDTVAFREQALALLCIAGLGGLPQVSIPAATRNGLPIGLSLIAARGHDEMLLSLARDLAEPLGLIQPRP